jgi:hypothetical protein
VVIEGFRPSVADRLGAGTRDVLAEAGYTVSEVVALRAAGTAAPA